MKPVMLLAFCVAATLAGRAQTDSLTAVKEILAFQKQQNDEFKDKAKSPLDIPSRKKFKSHDFYPINLAFRTVATLHATEKSPFFKMKTSTPVMQSYRVYGHLEFTLEGRTFNIPVYQSESLMKTEEYADYLFFPFTDLTNGEETYGGGRYIGLHIPKDQNTLILDFNMAYNPYCAYSPYFSCPVVPSENHIDMEIKAGTRLMQKHD